MARKGERLGEAGPSVGRSPRRHDKDAKLAALVHDADEAGPAVDAKKVGKKQVFRPILSSPFHARWNAIPAVHADVILHTLLQLLQSDSIKEHWKRENAAVPRSSSQKTKEKSRRRKERLALAVLQRHGIVPRIVAQQKSSEGRGDGSKEVAVQAKPFLCGLNSVTRQMETLIQAQVGQSSATTASTQHTPSLVFVCQSDIDPPTLVAHFPLLTSTLNAVCNTQSHLIRLPKGAEKELGEATNLRRCSVLSIDTSQLGEASGADREVKALLEKIQEAGIEPTRLDWLDKAVEARPDKGSRLHLLEPEVKHLRSSAPLDMNAHKAAKRAERTARKTVRGKRKLAKRLGREEQLRQVRRAQKQKGARPS